VIVGDAVGNGFIVEGTSKTVGVNSGVAVSTVVSKIISVLDVLLHATNRNIMQVTKMRFPDLFMITLCMPANGLRVLPGDFNPEQPLLVTYLDFSRRLPTGDRPVRTTLG